MRLPCITPGCTATTMPQGGYARRCTACRKKVWEQNRRLEGLDPDKVRALLAVQKRIEKKPDLPAEKRCGRCGEVRSTSLFYVDRSRRDGISGHCKHCVRRNPARGGLLWGSSQVKIWGIPKEELLKIFEEQGRCCKVCRTPDFGTRGPCVDHCHKTNHVRGILCWRCNVGVGLFNDSPDLLRSAAAYLGLEPTGLIVRAPHARIDQLLVELEGLKKA